MKIEYLNLQWVAQTLKYNLHLELKQDLPKNLELYI